MPKLNKTIIDTTQPAATDVWVWCSELEGFGLRVKPSGRKTYVVRYRTKGTRTQRKHTLGRCSDFPPEKARELARRVFAQVAEGGDPAAKAATSADTMGDLFQAYVDGMVARNCASASEVERVLLKAKDNAADALGRNRPPGEVTPAEVVAYVAKAYKRGHRGAADKARSYIASAYAWAMKSANDYTVDDPKDWGVRSNPAAEVQRDAGANGARDRNLSATEVRTLWKAIEAGCFGMAAGACIRLQLGTGQRVQEILRMDGREIDLGDELWKMPAHKTKGGIRPHAVPLPAQVLPILRELIKRHGDGPLFPSRQGSAEERVGHRSINHAIGRWLARPEVRLQHFQARDLRRTWKSRGADAGIDRFTRDLIQQHAKHDTGSKNYDMADYLPQMREAMGKWSAWLDRVLSDDQKVRPIKIAR